MMAAILAFIKGLFSKAESDISTLSGQIAKKEDKWTRLDIPANGNKTFTFGTSTSKYGIALVITAGYGADSNGMYLLERNNANLVKTDIKTASNMTITMDGTTGVVTIASSVSNTTYAVVKPITAGVYFN